MRLVVAIVVVGWLANPARAEPQLTWRADVDIQVGAASGVGAPERPGYVPSGARIRLGATTGVRKEEVTCGVDLGGALRVGFDTAGEEGQIDASLLFDSWFALRSGHEVQASLGPLLGCGRRGVASCRGPLVDPAFTAVAALWGRRAAVIVEAQVVAYDLPSSARPLGTYVSVTAGFAGRGTPAKWMLVADAIIVVAYAISQVELFTSF